MAPGGGFPWRQGFEVDIDWAGDHQRGHIHFPGQLQPGAGEALFEVGTRHAVCILARGPAVTVSLDGRQALRFESDQFPRGYTCLEGAEPGVAYRSLRLSTP